MTQRRRTKEIIPIVLLIRKGYRRRKDSYKPLWWEHGKKDSHIFQGLECRCSAVCEKLKTESL